VADEEAKHRGKAADNAWYKLATLHGLPGEKDGEIKRKNRVTWNRWVAQELPDDIKTTLLQNGWTEEELTPFSTDERRTIAAKIAIPLDAVKADFSNTEFEETFFALGFVFAANDFRNSCFRRGAHFNDSFFRSFAEFGGVTFGGWVDFRGTTFSASSSFTAAVFRSIATFYKVNFNGTWFDDANFSHEAEFTDVVIRGLSSFRGTIFTGPANFTRATFGVQDTTAGSQDARFINVIFNSTADFHGATFTDEVDFTNSELKGVTTFNNISFAKPPRCFNTKLHEGTTWHGVKWPTEPSDPDRAQDFADAYERLKLEMDKLKKHGDELDFFARELQCRRVVRGLWKGLPLAVYGFLCNYGRSYARPLLLLVVAVLLGVIPFALYRSGGICSLSTGCHVREALGISFANTAGLFGKPLIRPEIALADFPDWLKAIATMQTIVGIVLLFLFGLGVRNQFRMK
jgi:uncharacterized protein YjbI with pentapeptide repeats